MKGANVRYFTTNFGVLGRQTLVCVTGVVIVTPNTDATTTQLQLLTQLGADLSRIEILSFIKQEAPDFHTGGHRPFSLPEDFLPLFQAIKRVDARLIIFDPFVNLLSREKRITNQDLGYLLADLNLRLIERNIACLLIRNCGAKGKQARPSVLEQSDHFATIAVSRLLLAPDPMQPDHLLLSHGRSRHTALTPTLAFQIQPLPDHPDLPHIRILGSHTLQARDLIENRPDALHRQFLSQQLFALITEAPDPIPVATLYAHCPHSSAFQIQRSLSDLLRLGQIERPARGFYAKAPTNPVFPQSETATTPAMPGQGDLLNGTGATTLIPEQGDLLNQTGATTPASEPTSSLNGTGATPPTPEPANGLNGATVTSLISELVDMLNGTGATTPASEPASSLNETGATPAMPSQGDLLNGTGATTPIPGQGDLLNGTGATPPIPQQGDLLNQTGATTPASEPADLLNGTGATPAMPEQGDLLNGTGATTPMPEQGDLLNGTGATPAMPEQGDTLNGTVATTPMPEQGDTLNGTGATTPIPEQGDTLNETAATTVIPELAIPLGTPAATMLSP